MQLPTYPRYNKHTGVFQQSTTVYALYPNISMSDLVAIHALILNIQERLSEYGHT